MRPRHSSWLGHLLHRTCPRCFEEGHAAGFHEASVIAERRERHLRAGLDPDDLEKKHRAYLIEHEVADAA